MKEESKEQLREIGLQELEVFSKRGIEALFKAVEIIVNDTENKIDDMVIPFLPIIKARLLDLVDLIHKGD